MKIFPLLLGRVLEHAAPGAAAAPDGAAPEPEPEPEGEGCGGGGGGADVAAAGSYMTNFFEDRPPLLDARTGEPLMDARTGRPVQPFRVSVCAARALNAAGQSRVTLSLL